MIYCDVAYVLKCIYEKSYAHAFHSDVSTREESRGEHRGSSTGCMSENGTTLSWRGYLSMIDGVDTHHLSYVKSWSNTMTLCGWIDIMESCASTCIMFPLFMLVAPLLYIFYFWIDDPFNGCVGEYTIRSWHSQEQGATIVEDDVLHPCRWMDRDVFGVLPNPRTSLVHRESNWDYRYC